MEISECPQCGAAATPSDRKCGYCKAEFFVTSLAYLGSFDSSGVGKYLKHYKELTRRDPRPTQGQRQAIARHYRLRFQLPSPTCQMSAWSCKPVRLAPC